MDEGERWHLTFRGATRQPSPGAVPWTTPGEYSLRLHRIITIIVALASLSTDVLSIPAMLARRASDPLTLDTVRFVPLVALPLVAGILAGVAVVVDRTRPPSVGRSGGREVRTGPLDAWADVLLWSMVVWYLFLLLIAPIGHFGGGHEAPVLAPDQDFVVSFSTPVVAATCLLVGRRARFALAVLVAALSAQFMMRTGLWSGPADLQGPVFLLAFNTIFLAAATWVFDQGRRMDVSHESRERSEAEMRLAGARDAARRRTNDFVHDHVLSALVPAAAGLEDGERLRTAARVAVRSLEDSGAEDVGATAEELFATVARRAREKLPEVQVRSHVIADHELPPDAARALLDATGEALANSERHATERRPGAGVRRSVLMVSAPSRVVVTVDDDGRGFDESLVPPRRHGIRHSIVKRMVDVGGRARVDTEEGHGTRVELEWEVPGVEAAATGPLGTAGPGVARRTTDAGKGSWEPAREGPWTESVASSMQTRGARLVGLYALVAHVYLVATSAGVYVRLLPVLLALLAQFGAGVLLLRSWPGARLPRWVSVAVPAIIGGSNLVVLLQIPRSGWPGYAAWSLGSATMLCWGLIMRERRLAAWSGWGMLVLSTAVWVLITGRPLALAASMTVGHLLTVALWDLVASWSGRAARSIAVDERRQIELAAEARAQAEVRRLEDEAMTSVAERSVPLLEEISSGAPLTPELRMRARLLEAELRDEIRAPCFTGTAVVPAARAARSRGVEVVLLDDGPGQALSPDLREVLVREVVGELDSLRGGRAVVRRLPPGRPLAATVVAGGSRLTVSPEGVVGRG